MNCATISSSIDQMEAPAASFLKRICAEVIALETHESSVRKHYSDDVLSKISNGVGATEDENLIMYNEVNPI